MLLIEIVFYLHLLFTLIGVIMEINLLVEGWCFLLDWWFLIVVHLLFFIMYGLFLYFFGRRFGCFFDGRLFLLFGFFYFLLSGFSFLSLLHFGFLLYLLYLLLLLYFFILILFNMVFFGLFLIIYLWLLRRLIDVYLWLLFCGFFDFLLLVLLFGMFFLLLSQNEIGFYFLRHFVIAFFELAEDFLESLFEVGCCLLSHLQGHLLRIDAIDLVVNVHVHFFHDFQFLVTLISNQELYFIH